MELLSPVRITPRLLPGVSVGGAWVSIEYAGATGDNRQRYRWFIDLDGAEYHGDDLASGVGGGSLQEGLSSLLSFLGAFAEAHQYSESTGRTSDNEELFPAGLADWAVENSDELAMAGIELEETDGLIRE